MRTAVREFFYQRVNDHIPRAGVEGEDIFRFCMRGNYRDVGDSADVQGRAVPRRVAVKQIINEGPQRSPLSAGGHIRRTKLPDGRHTCALGDYAGLANLQRRGYLRIVETGRSCPLMVDRLPMRTDQREFSQRNSPGLAG